MNTFNYGDDIIDSRAIIARLEELQGDLDSLNQDVEDAQAAFDEAVQQANATGKVADNVARAEALDALNEARGLRDEWQQSDEAKEYDVLTRVAAEGEDYSDWHYGETLIKATYFVEYIEQLIDECYPMPGKHLGVDLNAWPYRHMTMDYEAAADAKAEQDYATITIGDDDYFICA